MQEINFKNDSVGTSFYFRRHQYGTLAAWTLPDEILQKFDIVDANLIVWNLILNPVYREVNKKYRFL